MAKFKVVLERTDTITKQAEKPYSMSCQQMKIGLWALE
jgi:hypothetical protein